MEYPIGDLLDRLAIASLKVEFLDEAICEYEALDRAFARWSEAHPEWELHKHLVDLIRVNREIWGYEADLRRGQLEEYPVVELTGLPREQLLQLAAVGMSALRIRNANRKRAAIRNELAEITKTGWPDVKVNHASEDIKIEGVVL